MFFPYPSILRILRIRTSGGSRTRVRRFAVRHFNHYTTLFVPTNRQNVVFKPNVWKRQCLHSWGKKNTANVPFAKSLRKMFGNMNFWWLAINIALMEKLLNWWKCTFCFTYFNRPTGLVQKFRAHKLLQLEAQLFQKILGTCWSAKTLKGTMNMVPMFPLKFWWVCVLPKVSDFPIASNGKLKNMHRAGQRCFELLALIGSPQLL